MTNRRKPVHKTAERLAAHDLGHLRETLVALKQTGSYPVTVGRLLDLANLPAALAVQIGGQRKVRNVLMCTTKTNAKVQETRDALVVLTEDRDWLAETDQLFVHVLERAQTESTQLFTAAGLAERLYGKFQEPFKHYWRSRAKDGPLPRGVGALSEKGHLKLFLLRSIRGGEVVAPWAQPAPLPAPPAAKGSGPLGDLMDRVLTAFDRIDGETGGRNYVTLRDLRTALVGESRSAVDDALNALRRRRVVTLDSADGRHERLSNEEIEAGLVEGGSRLVYMARRTQ